MRPRPDRDSVYGQYTIRVRGGRGRMQDGLKAKGIPTAVHYPLSLHQQPAYAAQYVGQSFPASERLAGEVVSLPMHADLDAATQRHIAAAIDHSARVPA
jgi:UDP-2-acetamido-2-deoxy-ribo-hexuluronate aminotransferase